MSQNFFSTSEQPLYRTMPIKKPQIQTNHTSIQNERETPPNINELNHFTHNLVHQDYSNIDYTSNDPVEEYNPIDTEIQEISSEHNTDEVEVSQNDMGLLGDFFEDPDDPSPCNDLENNQIYQEKDMKLCERLDPPLKVQLEANNAQIRELENTQILESTDDDIEEHDDPNINAGGVENEEINEDEDMKSEELPQQETQGQDDTRNTEEPECGSKNEENNINDENDGSDYEDIDYDKEARKLKKYLLELTVRSGKDVFVFDTYRITPFVLKRTYDTFWDQLETSERDEWDREYINFERYKQNNRSTRYKRSDYKEYINYIKYINYKNNNKIKPKCNPEKPKCNPEKPKCNPNPIPINNDGNQYLIEIIRNGSQGARTKFELFVNDLYKATNNPHMSYYTNHWCDLDFHNLWLIAYLMQCLMYGWTELP